MTNFETLIRAHRHEASNAIASLSMLARCHYDDGHASIGRFYGQLSDAVYEALEDNE